MSSYRRNFVLFPSTLQSILFSSCNLIIKRKKSFIAILSVEEKMLDAYATTNKSYNLIIIRDFIFLCFSTAVQEARRMPSLASQVKSWKFSEVNKKSTVLSFLYHIYFIVWNRWSYIIRISETMVITYWNYLSYYWKERLSKISWNVDRICYVTKKSEKAIYVLHITFITHIIY